MEPAHWKKGFTSNIDYVELYYLDLFHDLFNIPIQAESEYFDWVNKQL